MTSLEQVNDAAPAEFARLLDGIYEHSSWIVERAAPRRPFATLAQLKRALVEVVRAAGRDAQLKLLRAHPELAGKAMVERRLTASSTDEQTRAGLTACTPDELARIAELNAAYQKKFGFPFILAVRGYDRHGIIANFEARVNNSRADELRASLDQIYRIARFRLDDLIDA
jgi:2-oxo-4-hydroxy-4-carboxy-5-ureidoimidazoline decarboxylase